MPTIHVLARRSILLLVTLASTALAQWPPLDPLDASDDRLYAIWRRGLITRHISANGRLLEYVGLESIDEATGGPVQKPQVWQSFTNGVPVQHPQNVLIRVPLANTRYSVEETPGEVVAPRLWVPIVAPSKNPGASNEGLYFVSGGGDNALYYGGMAMATFALEQKLGVAPNSIEYARRLLPYFQESEVPVHSGNIVRSGRLLNSGHNPDGGPIIRGASAEELLGAMVGLMYFLKTEPAGSAWHYAARTLRDRILDAVARDWGPSSPLNSYGHPFIPLIDQWTYKVKAFEYPMNQAFGVNRGRKTLFKETVRGQGDLPGWFDALTLLGVDEPDYYNYLIIMMSGILMLDGDASAAEKNEFAKLYLEDFVAQALRRSHYRAALRENAMLAVTSLMAVRELVPAGTSLRNPPQSVKDLFGDQYTNWQKLLGTLEAFSNSDSHNGVPFSWQHNLPWLNSESPRPGIWKDHNPLQKGGDWFTWVRQNRYYAKNGTWNDGTPGTVRHGNWANFGTAMTEAEFVASTAKGYASGTSFAEKELCGVRLHCDTQVEGAGLDLLFPRMLLAALGDVPTPVLPADEQALLPSLPYVAASPIFPNTVRGVEKHRTNGSGSWKVYGDRPEALRITHLPKHHGKFVTLSATSNDNERLVLWKVTPPDAAGTRKFEHVWAHFGDTFDNANLLVTEIDGDEVVVIVERGEKKSKGLDPHFLRISTWKVNDNNLERIDKWESSIKDKDSVQELDAWVAQFPDIDNKSTYLTVLFRSKSEINRLQVFRLERLNDRRIMDVMGEGLNIDGGSWRPGKSHLTGFESGRFVVYTQRETARFRLQSRQIFPTGQADVSGALATTDWVPGIPLDIRMIDWAWALEVVALVQRDGYLEFRSWYFGRQNGKFIYAGVFSYGQSDQTHLGRELLTLTPAFAEIVALPAHYTEFAVILRGTGFSARNQNGGWRYGAPGIRVLRGRVNMSGIASPEGWGVTGGGEEAGTKRLALSGPVCDGPNKQGCGLISVNADDERFLNLVFWSLNDPYLQFRWAAPTAQWAAQPQP